METTIGGSSYQGPETRSQLDRQASRKRSKTTQTKTVRAARDCGAHIKDRCMTINTTGKKTNTISRRTKTKAQDTTATSGEFFKSLFLLDVILRGLSVGMYAALTDWLDPKGVWSTSRDPWEASERLMWKLTGRSDTRPGKHTTTTNSKPEGSGRTTASTSRHTTSHSQGSRAGQTRRSRKK